LITGLGFVMPAAQRVFSQAARTRQAYLDSLRAQRDTLSVRLWRADTYLLKGYPERVLKDSTDFCLPYLFTSVPYLSYPAEDNSGRAPVPLWYQPDSVIGFRWGFIVPYYFIVSSEKLTYFATRRPYTQLLYQLGTSGPPKNNRRGDQRFQVIHTQPVGRRSQIQISFFRLGSTGFFQRQWSSLSNLQAGGYHRSKNGRWFHRAAVVWYRLRYEENGGLSPEVRLVERGYYSPTPTGDSLFTPIGRQDSWPVRLSGSEMIYNRWDVSFAQDYYVGTWLKDSLQRRAITTLALTALLSFSDHKATFTDQTGAADSFFTHNYWTTNASLWRGHNREVTAEGGLRVAPLKSHHNFSTLWVAARYSWLQVGQDSVLRLRNREIHHNLSLCSRLNLEVTRYLTFTTIFDLYFTGYTAGSFVLKPQLQWTSSDSTSKKRFSLAAGIWLQNLTPAFIQRQFISNHFQWNLDLRNQSHTQVWLATTLPAYGLGLKGAFTVFRYLFYYNNEAIPHNIDGLQSLIQGRLDMDPLFFSRVVHLPFALHVQKATTSAIRVPLFYGRAGQLIRHTIFKKKNLVEWGLDIFYHSVYEPLAWMPGAQIWYVQNGFKAGGYPVFNSHFSLAFGRFRASLLGSHLNRGLPRMPYWLAPGMPVMERSIRLSLQWGLFN
jgi:hypothetical protein